MAEVKFSPEDEVFMRAALAEAAAGADAGEVPVGAVVTVGGRIVGRGHNAPLLTNDPTAHAEVLALRQAAAALKTYRIPDAILYVTLEPCVMCIGAIVHARVRAIKYGARDDKAGALGSVYDIGRDGRLNHRVEVYGGLMEPQCAAILREFFESRRGG